MLLSVPSTKMSSRPPPGQATDPGAPLAPPDGAPRFSQQHQPAGSCLALCQMLLSVPRTYTSRRPANGDETAGAEVAAPPTKLSRAANDSSGATVTTLVRRVRGDPAGV